jgi:ATP diphosphatase
MKIEELLQIMTRLRDPKHGCPWDREQTFATIAPYTIEEAYEVADAIARNDYADLKDELGDLLFQVVFHSQMAREAGHFDFGDVVQSITDKMHRRHPHVFGNEKIDTAEQQNQAWEQHKAAERARKGQTATGLLDDVPVGLPALTRANKLGKRAATVGFEWPDWKGAREKLNEELAELDAVLADPDAAKERISQELGDVLFCVVNLARYLKVDPEASLRACSDKFVARFTHVEDAARKLGKPLGSLTLDEMDVLWNEAKSQGK